MTGMEVIAADIRPILADLLREVEGSFGAAPTSSTNRILVLPFAKASCRHLKGPVVGVFALRELNEFAFYFFLFLVFLKARE